MDHLLYRAAALLLVLALACCFAVRRRGLDGRMRDAPDVGSLTSGDIGTALGERATLVQFSTSACRDCRAAARVLADLAGRTPGVVHVEVDAEHHLDLVRRHGVMRAPTVLVADASGRVVSRTSGVPDADHVLDTLQTIGAHRD